jgi:hypothetical protein
MRLLRKARQMGGLCCCWDRGDPPVELRVAEHGLDHVLSSAVERGAGGSLRSAQQSLGEAFGGLVRAEAFAGSVVELVSDAVELECGDGGEIGAFGEVLAKQSVGVLVGAGAAETPGFVVTGIIVCDEPEFEMLELIAAELVDYHVDIDESTGPRTIVSVKAITRA